MSRHSARVAAVEILYGADVRGVPVSELLEDRPDADAYCRELVEGVERRRDEIDQMLTEHSRNWSPERMSSVDRNVLRVGAFELIEGDVPPIAVIDEAVEIAKRFSGEEAGAFVNGVLEGLRQSSAGGGGGAAGGADGVAGGGGDSSFASEDEGSAGASSGSAGASSGSG